MACNQCNYQKGKKDKVIFFMIVIFMYLNNGERRAMFQKEADQWAPVTGGDGVSAVWVFL